MNSTKAFFTDAKGNVAVIFAILLVPVLLCVGAALDYGRALTAKTDLQAALDAALLAAAHEPDEKKRQALFKSFLSSNSKLNAMYGADQVSDSLKFEDGVLYGSAAADVKTTVVKLAKIQKVRVGVTASLQISNVTAEIALVLDVSSSMVEEGRFKPMLEAAEKFVETIANGDSKLKNFKVAIVPFSSRMNVGLQNTGFLLNWGGNPPVPDRWINPTDHYSNSYKKVGWVDSSSFAMYNGKNYYWMGCVEPRIDFAVHAGGSKTTAVSEQAPSSQRFLAQDYNDKSGKSFCPPPIVPLTDKVSHLKSAFSHLTSQGSTRLDVGMLGAWYSLSPSWSKDWAGGSGPEDYSKTHRKIVVFMTDGRMNTKDNPADKNYDWVCDVGGDCDDYATKILLDVCDSMKAKKIVVYGVSYDSDADKDAIKDCASDDSYYFTASSSSGSDYITKVYEQIAMSIRAEQTLVLVD